MNIAPIQNYNATNPSNKNSFKGVVSKDVIKDLNSLLNTKINAEIKDKYNGKAISQAEKNAIAQKFVKPLQTFINNVREKCSDYVILDSLTNHSYGVSARNALEDGYGTSEIPTITFGNYVNGINDYFAFKDFENNEDAIKRFENEFIYAESVACDYLYKKLENGYLGTKTVSELDIYHNTAKNEANKHKQWLDKNIYAKDSSSKNTLVKNYRYNFHLIENIEEKLNRLYESQLNKIKRAEIERINIENYSLPYDKLV